MPFYFLGNPGLNRNLNFIFLWYTKTQMTDISAKQILITY